MSGSNVTSSTPVSANEWNLLAGVYNGETRKIFVNGIETGSNSFTGGIDANFTSTIGYASGSLQISSPAFYQGKIDEFSNWDYALTESEIQSYMTTSPTGSESGLVGYWNFNEGTGTTLTDLSGNGNHGTINGATWSNDVPPVSTISTDESNDFTIALDNYTITPVSTGNLTISFLPTVYGYLSAAAQIYTNDPDQSVVSVGMSGFGYYPSPDIELESSSIDFGNVMYGLTEQESFTIYNSGETELDIDTIYCTANFSVNPGNAGVGSGDSLDLDIIFTPDSDSSSFTGIMTIVSNDPDEDTLRVSLSGTGIPQAPDMEVSADLLDFGDFEQEQTITRQLMIYNNGVLDLSIEEINISGNSGFTTTFSDATVVPNDSVVVDFQFYTEDDISEAFANATIVSTNNDNIDISLQAGYFGPVCVSTTGSDQTGDGTPDNPFATIQYGINTTNDGDTVLVAAGTYVENIFINMKNISVIGEDIETTIIDGNQNGNVVYVDAASTYISELTIQNGGTSPPPPGCMGVVSFLTILVLHYKIY